MTLYVGNVAPLAINWTVTPDDLISDLTAVTSVVANIIYPGGARVAWDLDITSQSSSSLVASRALEATDLIYAGTYISWLSLTTADGVVPSTEAEFQIDTHG